MSRTTDGLPGEGGQIHVHRGEVEGFYIIEGEGEGEVEFEFLGARSVTPMTAGSFDLGASMDLSRNRRGRVNRQARSRGPRTGPPWGRAYRATPRAWPGG